MNVLFVHQNLPGQYLHLAQHLARDPANRVHFLTQPNSNQLAGIEKVVYQVESRVPTLCHPFSMEFDRQVTVGTAAAEAASQLAETGYRPDLIVGHAGWGELLYLQDVFANAPILGNFEFYYHGDGNDVGFDPEFESIFNSKARLHTRNATILLSFESVTWGHTATRWQQSLHPPALRAGLSVLHEGADTDIACPNPSAHFLLPNGRVLNRHDQVITYVARNLEPYRGFHTFMRALPQIQRAHPKAEVVLVGGDGVSYGAPHAPGSSFRQWLLDEVGDQLDLTRIHFVGQIAYDRYLQLLQLSAAHVYLTYPFVLSWSFIEAMSIGCVVIGSRTAPVMEVLQDGVNGLAVDFFSADAIAAAVTTALTKPRIAARLRRAARQTAITRYDLKRRQLPAWVRLLDDLQHGRTPETEHG
jgi:glycosyltransferase involved in cell wall biosynthesis